MPAVSAVVLAVAYGLPPGLRADQQADGPHATDTWAAAPPRTTSTHPLDAPVASPPTADRAVENFAPKPVPLASSPHALIVEHCRVHLRDALELAAERTGIVESVVTAGETVTAGQLVGQLRDDVLRRTLAIAEREAANDVELRFARKKAELDQLKYERALVANRGDVKNVVPELELRELRLAAEQSLLQLEQAEHQLEINRLKRDEQAEILATYRVVAPLDGLVTKVNVQPGEVVREGDSLLELANTRTLLIHGQIDLDRVHLLRTGAAAVFTTTIADANGRRVPRDYPARIATIDVKVEPIGKKVEFTAEIDNREGLLIDGLSGRLAIAGRPGQVSAERRLEPMFRLEDSSNPAAMRSASHPTRFVRSHPVTPLGN